MTDPTAVLRQIATLVRLHYCSVCAAPILDGETLTSVRKRETVCAACGLEEASEIAVHALTRGEPEIDLLTLQRASELLSTCAGAFAAAVDGIRRRAERSGR